MGHVEHRQAVPLFFGAVPVGVGHREWSKHAFLQERLEALTAPDLDEATEHVDRDRVVPPTARAGTRSGLEHQSCTAWARSAPCANPKS